MPELYHTKWISTNDEIKNLFDGKFDGPSECYNVLNVITSQGRRQTNFTYLLNIFYSLHIYSTISVFIVLYGSETRSFKLRVERRLWEFGNRELGRIYGLMWDEVTWERIKLNN
jgi:hypothetical protein